MIELVPNLSELQPAAWSVRLRREAQNGLSFLNVNFTDEQVRIAQSIASRVELMVAAKINDGEIFAKMGDYLPSFKRLMDTMSADALNELCQRFPGLYYFGKILENLASLIQSGEVKVPK